jgi:hypothetical protein
MRQRCQPGPRIPGPAILSALAKRKHCLRSSGDSPRRTLPGSGSGPRPTHRRWPVALLRIPSPRRPAAGPDRDDLAGRAENDRALPADACLPTPPPGKAPCRKPQRQPPGARCPHRACQGHAHRPRRAVLDHHASPPPGNYPPGAVSQPLPVPRDAGMVTRFRADRSMLCRRTRTGDTPAAASAPDHNSDLTDIRPQPPTQQDNSCSQTRQHAIKNDLGPDRLPGNHSAKRAKSAFSALLSPTDDVEWRIATANGGVPVFGVIMRITASLCAKQRRLIGASVRWQRAERHDLRT